MLRVAGYGGGLLATALASIFLLRYLGVVDFGRFMTVIALLGILQALTDAGLSVVGQRSYVLSPAPSARRDLTADLLGLRLTISVPAVAGATAFAWIAGYPPVLVWGTAVASASLFLTNIAGALVVPLSARLQFGAVTAVDLARNLAIAAGILGLVVVSAPLGAFFCIYVVAGALSAALAWILVGDEDRVAPRFSPAAWRPLLRASVPIAAGIVVNVVYVRVLVVATSLLSTGFETGLYAASFRVLEIFIGVPQMMAGAAFPILAHAGASDEPRLAYALQRLAEASLLCAIALVLGIAFGADLVIRIIGGPEFAEAAPVLRIHVFALLGAFLTQVWVFGLIAVGRQSALVVVNGVALIVVVVGGATLIPLFDARGAAVAAVVGEAVLATLSLVLLVRARPALRPDPRPALRILAAGLVGAAAGLVPGPPTAVSAVLAVLAFGVAARAFGAVPAELIAAVRPRVSE
jgi:O-antigen/teichoic acid export membrane protein